MQPPTEFPASRRDVLSTRGYLSTVWGLRFLPLGPCMTSTQVRKGTTVHSQPLVWRLSVALVEMMICSFKKTTWPHRKNITSGWNFQKQQRTVLTILFSRLGCPLFSLVGFSFNWKNTVSSGTSPSGSMSFSCHHWGTSRPLSHPTQNPSAQRLVLQTHIFSPGVLIRAASQQREGSPISFAYPIMFRKKYFIEAKLMCNILFVSGAKKMIQYLCILWSDHHSKTN